LSSCFCQEARELAVRGIDGKGLHILDVLPDSFAHVPGCLRFALTRPAPKD